MRQLASTDTLQGYEAPVRNRITISTLIARMGWPALSLRKPIGRVALTARRAATVLLMMVLTTMTAWADSPWGTPGNGTANDPYQISTAQQWKDFATMVNTANGTYGDKCYKLTADIEVTGTWSDAIFVFVGQSAGEAFRGTFDGGGHTLTFNFSTSSYGGAPFRYINGATIRNLRVAGQVSVSGNIYAAGIAGYAMGSSSISGCTVGSTILSGGSGSGRHGGLVGRVESGATLTISGCTFSGSFTGSVALDCGGFVGQNRGTVSITDCLFDPSTVSIAAKYLYSFCNDWGGSSTLTRAYRTFDSGIDLNQGTRVYTEAPATPLTKRTAFGDNTIYVDGAAAITGVNDAYGYTGSSLALPTAGVRFDGAALAAANYDVVFRNGSNAVVSSLDAPGTYTVTVTGKGDYAGSVSKTFTVSAGDGSQQYPYLIGTPAEWDAFAAQVTGGNSYSGQYVRLTADISVTTMAGNDTHSFNGTFLGGGHTLTVDISGTSYIAPFRYVNDATISDLTVAGSVTSNENYAATLVAASNGNTQFTNCHSTATLNCTRNGFSNDGGFVGVNNGTLTFDRCSFKGSLLGAQTYWCGGFVGRNQHATANFTDCLFAPAEVTMGTNGSGTFVQPGSVSSTTNFTRTYYTTVFGAGQGTKVTAEAPDGICKIITSAADGATYYDKVCSVSGIASIYPLEAEPVHPEPEVKDGSTTLTKDVDYVLHWDEERATEGDYTLTVSGIGSYTGSANVGYTVQSSTGTFGGQTFVKGTDGAGDYFVIATEQDLRNLATAVNAGNDASGVRFVQTADIDLSSGGNFTPIGLFNSPYDKFSGTYDGGHHAISGLTVNNDGRAGLFGAVYGTVRNVRLVSPSMTNPSSSGEAGTISAFMSSGSTVENCLVINPSVSGGNDNYRGAIVGRINNGTCRNCYFYGGNQDNAFGIGSGTNVSRVYKVTLSEGLDVVTAYSGDGTDDSGARISSGAHAGYYAPQGATVTLATADGYSIGSVSYNDGSDHTFTADANGNYSFTMLATDITVVAIPWTGTGSSTVPFIIANPNHLNLLAQHVNGGETYEGKYFKQTADITLSGDWTPIGKDADHKFSGHYNGDGHTISGLSVTVTNGQYAGLFGYIQGGAYGGNDTNIAEVHGVVLQSPTVTVTASSSAQYAGAVVGYAADCSRVYDNTVIGGTVSFTGASNYNTNNSYAGGVVGEYRITNLAMLSGNKVSGTTVSGGGICGGLAGQINYNTYMSGNVVDANVSSARYDTSGPQGHINGYCQGIIVGHCSTFDSDPPTSVNYYHSTNGLTAYGMHSDGIKLVDTPEDDNWVARVYTVTGPSGLTAGGTATATVGTANYYAAGATATLSTDVGLLISGTPTVSGSGATIGSVSADRRSVTVTLGTADATVTTTFTIDPTHFADNGDGTYTIMSTAGWNIFCDLLSNNSKGYFDGKTVKLGTDIGTAQNPVTRMAGGSQHDFTGTFDGQGHTLTLKYGSAGSPVNKQYVAPFLYTTDNNGSQPNFRNLTIDGSIYEAYTGSGEHHVGGLIAKLYGTVTIEHCTSNVSITSTGGAGGFVGNCESTVSFTDCVSHATIRSAGGSNSGFVGWSRSSDYTISFAGCLFNGKLLKVNGSGNENGGFIGWKGDRKTVTITNSICAPAALANGETMADGNSATFSREHANYAATITNSFYTETFGTVQGLGYSFASAPANIGTAGTAYTTSGITPYTRGLLYNGLYYMTPEAMSLADASSNNVTSMARYFADVTLTGRTLYKDGAWNTLCLPFGLTAEQIAAHADFAGATLMELDTEGKNGFDPTDGTLWLTFKTATAIEAGVPYIVKWAKAADYDSNPSDYDFTSPTFNGVTIDATASTTVSDHDEGLTEVQMVGCYSPVPVEANDKSILYLGSANTLYYSSADNNIRSFRAYFSVPYIKGNASAMARAFRLDFGDGETTAIQEMYDGKMYDVRGQSDAWYTLDGRKLDGKPSVKGIYIHGGKKVVIQ